MGDLGSLTHCVLEGDPDSRSREKSLRGQSLAIAIVLQAIVLAALLLMPLLAPGVLPPLYTVTPAPAYPGAPRPVKRNSAPATPRRQLYVLHPIDTRPEPRQTQRPVGEAPPMLGTNVGEPQPPLESRIPGGDGRGIVNLAPPAAVPANKRLPQSEGVMAARLIRRIEPVYPPVATLLRLSGVVRLRAVIGADGSVQRLEVLSGNPILARAAVNAVQQWLYKPTRLNGQPVEVETSITVTFILN